MSPAIAAELRRCAPLLEAAIARASDGTSAGEVVTQVAAGRAQLWAGERSCMVTQLLNQGGDVLIFVWLGAGDLAELLAMRPVLESWGRQQGATSAWINGRLGWGRVLAPHGYKMTGSELRKVLVDG